MDASTATRKASTSSRATVHHEMPASNSMTTLTLNLPAALDFPPSISPPPEEKIAYDPSIRHLQSRDRQASFGDIRSMDRKPLPSQPLERSASASPLYKRELRKESSLPEAILDGSLPEVVTPDMQAGMSRHDKHQREQSTGTYKSSQPVKSPPVQPTLPITPPPKAYPQPFSPHNEGMAMDAADFDTVTPLQLLGDQPDMIDCPFCLRRTETKVIKKSSQMTHIWATGLCLTTILGVCIPYKYDWCVDIEQHCSNCNRRVARKLHGEDQIEIFGTPLHLRQPSRYPAAEKGPEDEQGPEPPSKSMTPPV